METSETGSGQGEGPNRRSLIAGAAGATLAATVAPAGVRAATAVSGNGARPIVLIHGAWFGGWVWKKVAAELRSSGHAVSAPTLTGLGERRHLARGGYDLSTHIEDVVLHLEMEDLRNVDLVGWSYGGMVTTGVLARAASRIRSVIYFDAFVPTDGQSLNSMNPAPQPTAAAAAGAAETRFRPIADDLLALMGLTDPALLAFVRPRVVPQSEACFSEPVKAMPQRLDIPFSYIRCAKFPNPAFDRFAREARSRGDRVVTLETGHIPMLTHVGETASAIGRLVA